MTRHIPTAALLALLATSSQVAAQETAIDVEAAPRPEVTAVRARGAITVDGLLDEASWSDAVVIDRFVQSKPNAGLPVSERTEVRFLYDDGFLYIGAELWDSEPDRLTVPSLEQDFQSGNSDIFGVTLDTFLDRRNAFMLLINPRGALKEAQNFDDSRQENQAWEGIMEAKTRIHERGWTVEWAIPFTTLRFDPSLEIQDWGLQIMRRIRRKNEEGYWAPIDRRDRIHRMSKAGTLSGLRGIRSGRNVLVKPYAVSARSSGTPTAEAEEWSGDGGLDLKWGLTPRLTLDLTYRTDFSQVEVDQEQINLTRFSLFFPERRDFFTENSGVFSFGDIREPNFRTGSTLRDFTLFHSRRIGLHQGSEVPIVGGGRLTGRAGGFEIGALDLQTRAEGGLPAENFSVLRAKRNVEGVGEFGAIFVNRQATDGAETYNRTLGAEANLRPHPSLRINSYVATVSDSEGDGSDPWAGRVWAGWRDPLWDISAQIKHVSEDFDPGVGFVRRSGVRQLWGTAGVHLRPDVEWINEINPSLDVDRTTDLEGRLLTRLVDFNASLSYQSGASVGFGAAETFERLDAPFAVSESAAVPAGEYTFRSAGLSIGTSAGRSLWGRLHVSGGGFFNGDRRSIRLNGEWRPSYRLSFDYSAQRNRIDLPGSDPFDADVYSLRANVAGSTRFFVSAFLQYNAATELAVSNLRVNYIHAPLSDLFLVFTERRDRTGVVPVERLISFKVTKALAF